MDKARVDNGGNHIQFGTRVDFLQETTYVEALTVLYPSVHIIIWKAGVILPSVNYLFSSQWLLPTSHDIWHDPGLDFVFSSVKNPRCKIYLD
jgi:hypothetical protein